MQRLIDLIVRHEGLTLHPVLDAKGCTIIGVGRNLSCDGISKDEALLILKNDIHKAMNDLRLACPWFDALNTARQAVLIDMCFSMGWKTLSGFKSVLGYISTGAYDKAADRMLGSLWATQCRDRVIELSQMMRSGAWPKGSD